MRQKNHVFFCAMILSLLVLVTGTVFAFADSNLCSFSVKLPGGCENTTLVSTKKTTGKNYGKVTCSRMSNLRQVNVWFRQKSGKSWVYKTNDSKYLKSFKNKGETKTIYYYKVYKKGTTVNLRAENNDSTWFSSGRFKGTVYMN